MYVVFLAVVVRRVVLTVWVCSDHQADPGTFAVDEEEVLARASARCPQEEIRQELYHPVYPFRI